MDYRDERDALRAQNEALEEELAKARADAEGKAELEEKLRAAEKKLARFRPPPDPLPRTLLKNTLIGVTLPVVIVGVVSFWRLTRAASTPAVAIEPAAVAPAEVPPAPVPTIEAPTEKLTFSLAEGGLAAFNDDVGDDKMAAIARRGVMAVTFEDTPAGRTYFAVGFDAASLAKRYRIGPYGSRAPHVWASGNRALIIDDAKKAHVIDTTKGHEIAEVTGLADAPSRVCIRGFQAWIASVDGASITVNLETGAGSVTAKSFERLCPPPPESKHNPCATVAAPFCGGGGPNVPGFTTKVVATSDAIAVALGVKSPGTPDVLAVGFDPKTRAVRWRASIAEDQDAEPLADYPPIVAALDDDLFVAIERLKSGKSKVRGFDAKTGASRFTTALAPDKLSPPLSLALGSDRVFVTIWGELFALDRKSGEVVQTLGNF